MSSSVSDFLRREIPYSMDWSGRFRLTVAAAGCFIFIWWASAAVGLPAVPGRGGSLLCQPAQSVAMGTTAGLLIVCTLIGRFIVGNIKIGEDSQSEGGLLAALLGMFAMVYRLGSVRYAYFALDDPKAFMLLAVELVLIFVVVGVCWLGLQWAGPQSPVHPELIGNKLAATATHVVVMLVCMLFLAQSERTGQAIAAVGFSAMLASMASHVAFPVRSSFWYWISPAIVGLIGYVYAFFDSHGLAIGFPDGALGALARAGPLVYATAGPIGAIFGYWLVYRWQNVEAEQAPQS